MITLRPAMAMFGLESRESSRGDQPATQAAAHEDACRNDMDERAFSEFHRRTERQLWAYLARLTGRSQLADDISQESYLRFLSRSERPTEFRAQKAYLFKIGTRLVIDGRRRAKFEGPWVDVEEPRVGSRPDRRVEMGRAMAKLKPRERALLWLAYVEQYTHEEIAEILGLKSSGIRVLLSRARERLSKVLELKTGNGVEGGTA